MKYLWIGLLIAALLIGGCFWSQRTINARAGAVAAPLEEALRALRAGDETRARELADKAAAEWTRHEGILASFISHDHTNGVAEALAELELSPGEELGSRLARLLKAVRELAEMERLTLENVF